MLRDSCCVGLEGGQIKKRQRTLITDTAFFLGLTRFTDTKDCEKEEIVPKLKTNSGAAKRFKKTGTGKFKAKRAFCGRF